uniref:Uncharacterized protein n=1 Tax=Meloidogyne enterolobii TaxID=390850 RepID=A0A6V7VN22_MELEN|nr:unnamed protein product [Meloidogyne enterolobii]
MATGNQCNLTPSTKFPHQWKLFNSLDKTTASKQQLGPKLYKIQTVFGDVLGGESCLNTTNSPKTFMAHFVLLDDVILYYWTK